MAAADGLIGHAKAVGMRLDTRWLKLKTCPPSPWAKFIARLCYLA
jgi:hypothetical protein